MTQPKPELDASQRGVLALEATASALVVGAPGTGKTTTLVELLADRVHHLGFAPESVLALTFDRSSASRLRDRLGLRIDEAVNGPLARTVSSLGFDIVAQAAIRAGSEPPTLLTGAEQDADVAALLAGHIDDGIGPEWPEPLGAAVRGLRSFRTELRELMMRATEHEIAPARMRALARQHGHDEWAAAADFIDDYLGSISSARADQLDSAELVRFAVAALERGEVSDAVSRLRLVAVDDLQEATELGFALLKALRSRGVAVVAFGDPDASTSVFRGGSADVVARFGAAVPQHVLRIAHRQPPALRELTRKVTEKVGTAGVVGQRGALPARTGDDPLAPLVRIEAPTAAREWSAVARTLRERHLIDGVPWSRLAVVVRSGALIDGAARALSVAEVPVRTTSAATALRDDPAARALLAIVDCGIGRAPLDVETTTELLLGPFGGLDRLALRRLRVALRTEEVASGGTRAADRLLVEAIATPGRLATIDHRIAREADRLARTLDAVRAASDGGAGIEELLWTVWERTGVGAKWRQAASGTGVAASEANRDLDGVVALFTAAKRFGEREPDSPPSVFLSRMLDADVPEDTLSPTRIAESVLVATPAGVVGQEFDVVVVGGLQDGVWPDLRVRGTLLNTDALVRAALASDPGEADAVIDARRQVAADELRMFAVAVSRASRQVVLAAVSDEDQSPSVLFGLAPQGTPTVDVSAPALTLRGLTGRLRRELTRDDASGSGRSEAAAALAELVVAGVPGADPVHWHGLARPTSVDPLYDEEEIVPVSPSRIEAIEDSPLDWFLDDIAGSTTSTSMGIGTIVHWAMETAKDPAVDALFAAVDSRWNELVFEAPWIAAREKRAVRRLVQGVSEYLADADRAGTRVVAAETGFRLDVGRAQVHGKIDRVEADPSGGITIVDLKTGRPETSAGKLAAMPQLGVYQLAYASGQLDELCAPHAPHRSAGAKLLFVKDGVRGKLYREGAQGALDDEGLESFRERIRQAARAIAVAEFEGKAELDDYKSGVAVRRLHRVKAVCSD
ncbi:ATP-dependent helicase [Planctomonas sp. JC2975]|uniref:PD-(D/E)XK nuclease family protein n=1 Tax=Planctomonas sp. JC2975 TaxID=2729626 RepID=UPI001472746B|nr:ATP-dependent helicase [Planctomonas sp. JC2975]